MELTIDVEKTEDGSVDLAIAVPSKELDSRKDAVLAGLRDRVALPGFRKGHVPKSILEKRFGPQAMAEGLDELLKNAVQEAFEKKNLVPADAPKISDLKMEDGSIRFKVSVEVQPEIAFTDEQIFKIPVPKADLAVTEDDITAAIENERKTTATFQPILEIRPIQNGDFAVIDYEGYLKDNDSPIPGGKAEGSLIEVGSKRFLPGFDEQLLGVSVGDRRRVDLRFPDDFYDEDLKGKAAYFHVKVHSIKKRQMPEVTDEWAKEQGYESIADFRGKIRSEMERGAADLSKEAQRRALIDGLLERVPFEPPKSFVLKQSEELIKNLERQYKGGRKELLDQLAKEGKTEADLESDARERAKRQVKTHMVLHTIGRVKQITATDEDLAGRIAQLADQYQSTPADLQSQLEKDDRLDDLRHTIQDEKIVQFLMDHADIR